MWIFLMVFLSLYGGMNYYLFHKVRRAWPGHPGWLLLLGLFLLLMVASPILMRSFERKGMMELSRIFSWIGDTWIALIFWFVFVAAVLDLWNLLIRIAAHFKPGLALLVLTARAELMICGILIACASIWGVIEASNIRLKEVHLKTPSLADGAQPVRIALISDVHLSLTLRRARLEKIVGIIRTARPDILLCAGDLADGSFRNIDQLGGLLKQVQPPLGKFAVIGNHEYYSGLQGSLEFLTECGFQVLRGEAVQAGAVCLVGVDDPAAIRDERARRKQEADALAEAAENTPAILLKHRPEVEKSSIGKFDLQVSGHSHGGQIFPFNIVTKIFYPAPLGMSEAGSGSHLYHSHGTGTWGPRMRLFSPPEVTLIVLDPE